VAALPTGAGVPRVRALPFGDVAAARFLPDGDRMVLAAREKGGPLRLFVADFGGEPPRAFGPDISLRLVSARETAPMIISPDGRFVAYAESAGGTTVVPIEGGEVRRVPGVGVNEIPVQWSADGRRLFMFDQGQIPARLVTRDIAGGEARLVRLIEPRDPVGVSGIWHISITQDGQAYAYSYQQNLSDLFLVEGLQ
jgi:Tol biopolymer transport system component